MTRSFFSEVSEASEDYATEVDEINDFNFISDVDEATLINGVYEATDLKVVNLATESIKVTENIESTDSPKHWPSRKKCWILFVLTITETLIITTGSILFPALKKLRKEFDTSEVAVNSLCNISSAQMLVITHRCPLFREFMSIVYAAYSDRFATRRNACGSSSTVSVGAGIISDIYFPKDRGFAFGIFSLAPATLIGTASGGYIIEYLNWRWIYYSLAIYGGTIFFLILFFIPETSCQVNQQTRTPQFNSNNSSSKNRFNPFAPLKLLAYPNFVLTVTYMSIILSMITLQNISVARNFSARSYNLAPSTIGLLFLAPTLGNSFGSAIGGKCSDFILQRARKNGVEIICPEMRIKSATIGALMVPCSYLVYGWLLTNNFNMYVLMILWFFNVFGTYIVYNSLSPYLIDACPGLSASAIALSYCIRLIMTGVVAIFGSLMEDSLGTGWYYTLISSLCLLPTFFLVLVYFNGKQWKEKFFREE
ncbi:MFS general substrate transporter [Gigaspora margarita]|uniref:MFS general substrate transporter n=1 Tax=Gigaspora margarita TaxID=4874 RepID=A0A8H4AGN5_GIGMA|nr:MFS general substrate transporter [Gigaspora margarita]